MQLELENAHCFAKSFLMTEPQLPDAPLCPCVQQKVDWDAVHEILASTLLYPEGHSAPIPRSLHPEGIVQAMHSSPAMKSEHCFELSSTIVCSGMGAANDEMAKRKMITTEKRNVFNIMVLNEDESNKSLSLVDMGRRKRIGLAFMFFLLAAIAFLFSAGYMSLPSNIALPANPVSSAPSVKSAGCGNLSVHILNVSQADGIVIITPGNKTILIDSGSSMKKDSADRVVSYLSSLGIAHIDYIIATHMHEDHIGGMDRILPLFDVGTIYTNGNCANSASKTTQQFMDFNKTRDFRTVNSDMDLPSDGCLDEAKLIVAYDRANGCWSDENDNSILLRIVYGDSSFLFTGDCEGDCEKELVRQGTNLKADVLKVAHHGSSTSSGDPFLSSVRPKYAVISVDKNRSVSDGYFHPRKSTIEKLYGLGSDVFRTDLNGNIEIDSDGSRISINPQSKADDCAIFRGYMNGSASSYGIIPQLEANCG